MNLDKALCRHRDAIRKRALESQLDFHEVVFEVVDFQQMSAIAAYGGFPNRYPHWRFGMQYGQLSKTYTYGMSKIYEMVINTDPCYAYLLEGNSLTDQKMVMAHVYGHADFFKNNLTFKGTNRKMMDEMGNHRSQVRRMMNRFGVDVVEDWIDTCLSLENLIDFDHPGSTRDILQFLMQKAPLKTWQQEIISIIREEALYFYPQAATKVMNEGWASFWHAKLMTEQIMHDSEVIDYADHNSGTLATGAGRLNPYKLGVELFRDIEDRWNKGKFGRDFEICDNLVAKKNWDKKTGQGLAKIFEVRSLYKDLTFLDAFLTEEFCLQQKLYTYEYNAVRGTYEIKDRDFQKVKEKLLHSLTNNGNPILSIPDLNLSSTEDLVLQHHYDGVDLRHDYAVETLKKLYLVWQKPVRVETMADGAPLTLSYDGGESVEKKSEAETKKPE